MSWKDDLALDAMFLRVINGRRGTVVQSFNEMRKKQGMQWEASRMLTIAGSAPTSNANSILLTGSKPVVLESRVLGYTGVGVVGEFFKLPAYTGGTPDPWHNLNSLYVGTQPETQILVGITLTGNGTRAAADIHGIGPGSNQAMGSTPKEFGASRVLSEPSTPYLFVIRSLDSQPQSVTARIEIYEGYLDYPNSDYP